MKSFFYAFLLLLSVSSCNMKQFCLDRFPPVQTKDSMVFKTITKLRDTTIFVTIPPQTLVDTVYLDTTFKTASSYLTTSLASATAFWNGHYLIHELRQNDSTLAILLRNAISENTSHSHTTIEKTNSNPTNTLTSWQNFQIAGFKILLIIVILLLIWKNTGSWIATALIKLLKRPPKT